MGFLAGPTAGTIGTILSRVVVPLWILTGAAFKLQSGSPRTLPTLFLDGAKAANIDLGTLFYTLIGLELFAIGVMWFIPRFARAMAMFMLASFCLILVGEIWRNAESCGCFGGTVTVKPWQMLLIDGLLLLGVAIFVPKQREGASTSLAAPAVTALALLVGGFAISFGADAMTSDTVAVDDGGDDGAGDGVGDDGDDGDDGGNGGATTAPPPLPAFWYVKDIDTWIGKRWNEIDLLQFIKKPPSGMTSGTRYVVFYGRTCDHCEEMFLADFIDPGLGSMVTAVEVPVAKDRLRGPNEWQMVKTEAEHRELPLGPDWIITTPLVVTIVDGVVQCAEEGEHKVCMGLE